MAVVAERAEDHVSSFGARCAPRLPVNSARNPRLRYDRSIPFSCALVLQIE